MRYLSRILLLPTLLLLWFGARQPTAAAPTAVPDQIDWPVSDYVIVGNRITVLDRPVCAPTRAPESVSLRIARTFTHGAPSRTLLSQTYDEDCTPVGPEVLSDIAADGSATYYVSDAQNALVQIPHAAAFGDTPLSVQAFDGGNVGDTAIAHDGSSRLFLVRQSNGLYRKNLSNNSFAQLLSAPQIGSAVSNLQTDGTFVYWRDFTAANGWWLRRYRLSDGSELVPAADVNAYIAAAGGLFIGFNNGTIRFFNNTTNTLGSPIYSGPLGTSIHAITFGNTGSGSRVFFILNTPTGATLYRMRADGGGLTALYSANGQEAPTGPLRVSEDGAQLYFLTRGFSLLRLATNADSVALVDVRAIGLEVTQAIQNDTNSVPLVRDRATVVRVFADGPPSPSFVVTTAHLYRINAAGAVLAGPLLPNNSSGVPGAPPNIYLAVRSDMDRDRIGDAFTFVLPPAWLSGGSLRVRAVLNPYLTPAESNYANNQLDSATFTLNPSARLETQFVLYEYEIGGTRFRARDYEDYRHTLSYIRRTYPVASTPGFCRTPSAGFRPCSAVVYDAGLGARVNQTAPGCSDNLCASAYVNGLLRAMRVTDRLAGNVFMYGMISDQAGFFPRGQEGGSQASSGPAGPNCPGCAFGTVDTDATYGDWYAAHEIAHSLGRAHPSASAATCGNSADDGSYPYTNARIGPGPTQRGFDVGDVGLATNLQPAVLPASVWADFTSYCLPQWVSDYTYSAIRSRLAARAPAGAPADARAARDPQATYKLIATGVLDDGGLTTTLVRVLVDDTTQPLTPDGGNVIVRQFDAGGSELASITLPLEAGELAGQQIFDWTLDLNAATRKLTLADAKTFAALGDIVLSNFAPTVVDVQLDGVLPGALADGTQLLKWQAQDSDSDALLYDVLLSHDGGLNWQTIQSSLPDPQTTVDLDQLPGGDDVRFRIIARDGARTGQADSLPYVVLPKPPRLQLLYPADNSVFQYGQTVLVAVDYADPQAAPGRAEPLISWFDGQTFLGNGAQLALDGLTPGWHTLNAIAFGSGQTQAFLDVSVYIDETMALPADGLVPAQTQVVWHVAPGAQAPAQTLDVRALFGGQVALQIDAPPWLYVLPDNAATPLTLTLFSYVLPPAGQQLNGVITLTPLARDVAPLQLPVSLSVGNLFGAENNVPTAVGVRGAAAVQGGLQVCGVPLGLAGLGLALLSWRAARRTTRGRKVRRS